MELNKYKRIYKVSLSIILNITFIALKVLIIFFNKIM